VFKQLFPVKKVVLLLELCYKKKDSYLGGTTPAPEYTIAL